MVTPSSEFNFKRMMCFCLVALCAACNMPMLGSPFDFSSSEFVKFNEVELNADQIRQLETVLNSLERKRVCVLTKPAHQITFNAGGELRFISIFEEENFVFQGYYLDAWEDRMKDVKSRGYMLSRDLEKIIMELKTDL